jgi:hypothetical protein
MEKPTVIMKLETQSDDWFGGSIHHENGDFIGQHVSSSLWWLEKDLKGKLDDVDKYNIVKQF